MVADRAGGAIRGASDIEGPALYLCEMRVGDRITGLAGGPLGGRYELRVGHGGGIGHRVRVCRSATMTMIQAWVGRVSGKGATVRDIWSRC